MEMKFFFSVDVFQFLKFYEKVVKLDKRNFKREIWTWHLMLKVRKITGKIGFQFCKLIFLGVSDQAICTFA